ncbi:predicted protein [Botrytis cinerea T4]|uniref:Uncharacterized protein n=1 Tax=Botryotinia fuckeliana (strain T4) TaxID=999810 RepID=G2Y1A5_BOTF4|nr:predicted protein [Botrytis cinerea T4]
MRRATTSAMPLSTDFEILAVLDRVLPFTEEMSMPAYAVKEFYKGKRGAG